MWPWTSRLLVVAVVSLLVSVLAACSQEKAFEEEPSETRLQPAFARSPTPSPTALAPATVTAPPQTSTPTQQTPRSAAVTPTATSKLTATPRPDPTPGPQPAVSSTRRPTATHAPQSVPVTARGPNAIPNSTTSSEALQRPTNLPATRPTLAPTPTPTPIQRPDLVAENPGASDREPDPDDSFGFSVTVHNRGKGPAPSTSLRYYLSDDSQVTTNDTQLDVDSLAQLPASRGTTMSVDLTAPSQAGTYYYGACVDPVPGESNAQNNCSPAVRVDVITYPDLVAEDPTASDRESDPDETFRFSVTVHNRGNGPAPSTTLRYYLSDDSQVTTNDTQLDVDSLAQLPAFTGATVSVELTAPSQAGTYYYGACVDPVPGESPR